MPFILLLDFFYYILGVFIAFLFNCDKINFVVTFLQEAIFDVVHLHSSAVLHFVNIM